MLDQANWVTIGTQPYATAPGTRMGMLLERVAREFGYETGTKDKKASIGAGNVVVYIPNTGDAAFDEMRKHAFWSRLRKAELAATFSSAQAQPPAP